MTNDQLGFDLLGFSLRFINTADHVESLLRQSVQFSRKNHLEALNRLFQLHILTRRTREDFRYKERLRQEALEESLDKICQNGKQLK